MKNEHRLALDITVSMLVFFSIFGFVFLFIYFEPNSLKSFFETIFSKSDFFWFDIIYFYIYVFFKIIFIIFWVYFISYFFAKKIFCNVNKNNKKLKEYNHYVAHELKTPISVLYSNLEILEYWYDKQKISNSKTELKMMIKIIDSLLNYSESIKIFDIKSINLENFLKKQIYFQSKNNKIKLLNREFNKTITTDQMLFSRVIKNLIDNWLKYSLDWILNIYIKNDRLIFENKINKTFTTSEINKMLEKYYTKTFEEKRWHWIWIPMIEQILNSLWYCLKIYSENNNFYAAIIFETND